VIDKRDKGSNYITIKKIKLLKNLPMGEDGIIDRILSIFQGQIH
jgi:hypothetical protein